MAANADIVTNLDQVVDLVPSPITIVHGAAVDGGAGPDLDIVLDDTRPTRGTLKMALRSHHEASVLADPAAQMTVIPA